MQWRNHLPSYFRFEMVTEDGVEKGKVSFVCSCGHEESGRLWPHLDEGNSVATIRCPNCHRGLTLRAWREDW